VKEFMDIKSLIEVLLEAENRHGDYEASAPKHHWSGWYAAYIFSRHSGSTPNEAAKDAARYMEGMSK
jgi:hypothetical protein